jgi:hypothetical protein
MKHRVLPAATGAMLALAAIPVLVVMPLRSAAETPKLKTGEVLKRTYDFKQAKKKMEYCLYVPKAYDKAKAWPLMVALHGAPGDQVPADLGRPGADRAGDLPQSRRTGQDQEHAGDPDPGRCRPARAGQNRS